MVTLLTAAAHRSLLSRSPLLGTTGRLAYLAALLSVLCLLAQPLEAPSPQHLRVGSCTFWVTQQQPLLAALLGLEASAWLHPIQDGDPMPKRPRLLRQPLRLLRRCPRR